MDFLLSPEARRLIGDYRVDGKVLFHPISKESTSLEIEIRKGA